MIAGLVSCAVALGASTTVGDARATERATYFGAYELGQMVFNEFKHIAGEVGVRRSNGHTLRVSFLNIALSERHLSSDEAGAVEGDSVVGLWRGAELLYDVPIRWGFAAGPSVGYFDSIFSHTELDESIRKKSTTAGLTLSYSESGLFGVESLYWRFSLTYRYNLNPIPRTLLGESVVRSNRGETTPAIFVGWEF